MAGYFLPLRNQNTAGGVFYQAREGRTSKKENKMKSNSQLPTIESIEADNFMSLVRQVRQQAVEEYKQELKKKVEGMLNDKRIPRQALRFGDCPKCGQEMNREWVNHEIKEVKDETLLDILKLLEERKE